MRWSVILLFVVDICSAQRSTLETVGDVGQIAIPASAGLAVLMTKDTLAFKEMAYSFSTTVLITQVLKNTIDKKRPNGKDKAFPSGHTSGSFQAAVFIYRKYGYQYGVPAVLFASVVGYSRIYGGSGKHDINDVLAGALIGTFSSLIFTSPRASSDQKYSLTLSPKHFSLTYRF